VGRVSVIIDMAVNARDAARDMNDAAGKFDTFGGAMKGLAAPAGIALGSIAGLALGAAKAASDLQQASGGVDAVFKTSAGTIHEWAKTSAESVGLAGAEYQTLAAGIGGALTGMGVPLDQATAQTGALITRAADLASVFGGTTTQATEALTSAFRGEYDSLQRLIPSISGAAVEAEIAKEAAAGQTFASEAAAQANAIYTLAMDGSAAAAGNFAKESDTAAGSQAIAEAKFKDTAAALGEQLLPAVTTVMEWLSKLGNWISEHVPLVTALTAVVAGFAAAILAANVVLGVMSTISAVATTTIGGYTIAQIAATAATWAFNAAMAVLTSPVTIVIAAIAAVIAIIVLLIKNWDTVSSTAKKAFDIISTAVGKAIDFVIRKIKEVLKWLKDFASNIPIIGGLFGGAQMVPAPSGVAGVAYAGAPSLVGVAPRLTSRSSNRSGGGGTVTVNVNGALDPVAVARQIRALLVAQDRRTGGVST